MSDERLRTLERAASTGDPAARVALLRARVRAGTLSQERLELAAYVGDADARAALGRCCAKHDALERRGLGMTRHYCAEDPLAPWVRGLSRWGAEVRARGVTAAARAALEAWCDSSLLSGQTNLHAKRVEATAALTGRGYCGRCTTRTPGYERPGDAVEAAEAWLACPCDDHASAAMAAYACWDPPGNANTMAFFGAAYLAGTCGEPPFRGDYEAEQVTFAAARHAGEPSVREAIRTALVQWALS